MKPLVWYEDEDVYCPFLLAGNSPRVRRRICGSASASSSSSSSCFSSSSSDSDSTTSSRIRIQLLRQFRHRHHRRRLGFCVGASFLAAHNNMDSSHSAARLESSANAAIVDCSNETEKYDIYLCWFVRSFRGLFLPASKRSVPRNVRWISTRDATPPLTL